MRIPKAELRKAIERCCMDCIYDKAEPGTWRKQVENCRVTSCALHRYRPRPIKSILRDRVKEKQARKSKSEATQDG